MAARRLAAARVARPVGPRAAPAPALPPAAVQALRESTSYSKTNKGGASRDMYEPNPLDLPEHYEKVGVDVEEVHAAVAEAQKALRLDRQKRLNEYDPEEARNYDEIKAVIEHLDATWLDYDSVPENLENVELTWETFAYPPYSGPEENRILEEPLHKVKVSLNVEQFNWTPTQLERFEHIVSQRYKPSTKTLTLVCDKHPTTEENFEAAKVMLSTLLEEVQKVE